MESFTCYGGGTFEIHEDHFTHRYYIYGFLGKKEQINNIPFEQIKAINCYKVGARFLTRASISIDTGAPSTVVNRLPNEIEFDFDEDMERAYAMIMKAYNDYINSKRGGTTVVQSSPADEIKKYKELLDSGVITQAEFDAKKKQLLGL